MHILVLGAAGMVGRKLTERLVRDGRLGSREITRLTLQDVVAPQNPAGNAIPTKLVTSDFADPGTAAPLVAERPDVAVIDSIQTVYSEALTSAPGSVAQVRECAAQLTRIAKQSGTAIIMVGHVTKEGNLAGPRVLEHIVDTVLYFEGDTHSSFRLVRAFKNRFGAVNELGVFAMTERGLRGDLRGIVGAHGERRHRRVRGQPLARGVRTT